MHDTLVNVTLPRGVWVDLYATTGITVGAQINVQNLTTSHVRLYSAAAAPVDTNYGYHTLPPYMTAPNDSGDTGAWALSLNNDGAVQVAEVV